MMKKSRWSHSPFLLKTDQVTFLVLLIILLTVSPASQASPQTETFIRQVMKELVSGAQKAVTTTKAQGQSKALSNLNQLVKGLGKVRYQYVPAQMTAKGYVNCYSNMGSQWYTQYDNPKGRYPLVTWGRGNSHPQDFSAEQWALMLHETISSLGVVDDEYQVSSTLLDLYSNYKAGQKVPSSSLEDLIAIEKRKKTPKFKLGKEELCYDNNGHLIEGQSSGNTTGIGGGGDGDALIVKRELKAQVAKWWSKNKKTSLNSAQYKKFKARVLALGVEPLEEHPRLIQTFPVQMEFIKSKRTGRLTVRFALDRILESDQFFISALNMIFAHLDKNTSRFAVYGAELAEWRGLIPKGTWPEHMSFDRRSPVFYGK